MQRMLAVLAANPAADGAGLIGMVCFIAWPLFQARSMMLIAYIGNNLCFALHYALLGHWTAAAMNGLMSVQTVVAIMLVRRPGLRWTYYALMPALALASVVTWQGAPSLLAAVATTLSTIGRMQTNDVILRVLLLAATPFWAVHDLIVGSFPGLIADVLSMATGATMLLRHSRCADRSDSRPIEGSREPRHHAAIPAGLTEASGTAGSRTSDHDSSAGRDHAICAARQSTDVEAPRSPPRAATST